MSLQWLPRVLGMLVLFLVCDASLINAEPLRQHKNVLLLHSYHQGYQWTDDETRGVFSIFPPHGEEVKVYTEYMGMKWAADQKYFDQLRETYKLQFKSIPFDVIIAADNDAFNFLRAYRDEVFGRVPTVFCGVNYFDPDTLRGYDLYTGINETADFKANLDLLLRLHPSTQQIVVIVDNSVTGQHILREISAITENYQQRVRFEYLFDLSMEDLLGRVSSLPSNTLVLYTIFFRDKNNRIFEYDESARLISRASKVPIYGTWNFSLGNGIIGGKLTDGFSQGRMAAELVNRIFRGEQPHAIPVVMQSPGEFMFDYNQMRRFNVPLDALPPESTVINRPQKNYTFPKAVVWTAGGAVIFLTGFIVVLLFTIHQRNLAQERLQASEEMQRSLLQTTPDLIVRTDIEGKIIFMNKSEFPGLDSKERGSFYGRSIFSFIPEQERPKAMENARQRLEKDIGILEYRLQFEDGTQVDAELNGAVVRDRDGKAAGMVYVVRNVSDRKRVEKDKADLQTQLVQAQKMESVGRLAGGVAHDFNNMLGVILGYTELAMARVEPDNPLHVNLERIQGAAKRSADLTQQLLTFARKQTVSPKVIDLNDTIESILKLLRRLIGEDIDLAWQPGKEVWSVKIDPSQIDQILTNLCVNARDAIADTGKVTIETGIGTFDEDFCDHHAGFVPGEYTLLAVSDNGCGMNKETQSHLFEPFFTTKEVGKGTGLGLATVYGVVKQNNGFISVYSELGQGTTFKIYLPRHLDKAVPLPKKEANRPAERGHETILLVEDESAFLEMTVLMLEQAGYSVLAAANPDEAIRLAKEHVGTIHLVMTDVIMPEMNGRDLVKNLLFHNPDLKQLFMSGYTANVIAHHGVLEENIHFIQKPFTLNDLSAKIREVLDC